MAGGVGKAAYAVGGDRPADSETGQGGLVTLWEATGSDNAKWSDSGRRRRGEEEEGYRKVKWQIIHKPL